MYLITSGSAVSIKANHPTLHSQVKEWFDTRRANNFEGINVSYNQQIEKGHHRTEKRYVWAVPLEAFGGLYQQEQWSGLQTIVIIERIRHLWNKTTREVQFYLTSLRMLKFLVVPFVNIGQLKTKFIGL